MTTAYLCVRRVVGTIHLGCKEKKTRDSFKLTNRQNEPIKWERKSSREKERVHNYKWFWLQVYGTVLVTTQDVPIMDSSLFIKPGQDRPKESNYLTQDTTNFII